MKIVSGGQTGADRAALDAADELGLETGGWVPKGRRAEDGRIPDRYSGLRETDSEDHADRTERNVIDSDATLIVSRGPLKGGSKLTRNLCRLHGRPNIHIDLLEIEEPEALQKIVDWVEKTGCRVLNVAGPRSSEDRLIYGAVRGLLLRCLAGPR